MPGNGNFRAALAGSMRDPDAAAARYQAAQQAAAQQAAMQAQSELQTNGGQAGSPTAPPPSANVGAPQPPAATPTPPPLGPNVPPSTSLEALRRLAGRPSKNPIQAGGYTQNDYKNMAGQMAQDDFNTMAKMKQPSSDDFEQNPKDPDAAQAQLDQANDAYQRGQQLKANPDLKQEFIDQQTTKYLDSMNRGEWPQR